MLTFDEAAHAYYWHGERVPNVTSIIGHLTEPLYARIPKDTLERARQEGVAIHKMVEAYVKGTLLEVPEWLQGRMRAFDRFLDETGFDPWGAEVRLFHAGFGYAGTMDLAGHMPKLKRARPSVIDVKRSLYGGPCIGLQTEGYRGAANHMKLYERLEKRYALQLNDNGSYRLEEYDDVDDGAAFLACLQQLKWRAKYYGQSRAGFAGGGATAA